MSDIEQQLESEESDGRVKTYDGRFDWDPGENVDEDPVEVGDRELELEDGGGEIGDRIQALEEEQESLLSSLMALTTHFAQVQFRLHQIVEAPEQERDILLKKLEDFADRGIPNCTELYDSRNIINRMDRQRNRQHELIEQLKNQLEDLEKYAYETGEPVLPQSILVEKQKVIIDELKQKMNLNFNELDLPQLSSDELRNHVDQAFGEFVSPLKMKEQLVAQLKTQVNDLERFIKFLQGEKYEKKMLLKRHFQLHPTTLQKQELVLETNYDTLDMHDQTCNCNASKPNSKTNHTNTFSTGLGSDFNTNTITNNNDFRPSTAARSSNTPNSESGTMSGKLFTMFNKASTLLHIFALSQIGGCTSPNGLKQQQFKKNTLKKTYRGNHWGDVRAKLEVDIQEVLSLAMEMHSLVKSQRLLKANGADTDEDEVFENADGGEANPKVNNQKRLRSTSTSSSTTSGLMATAASMALVSPIKQCEKYRHLNVELVSLVRKKFSITLQKLMQHGLRSISETKHLVPFISCFANFQMHQSNSRTNGSFSYPMEEDENCDYREMHAWELIIEYYNLKNGDYYNETPAQKLSQSYNLDISGDCMVSNKQSLLYTIRNIINIHSPYKRSHNSHFKAFVCAGLNAHKLVQWLHLIFQCKDLVNNYYTNWSYVANTGFRDALKSLDQLTKYDFDLPVDLAIRQFQNIKDVFL